MCQAVGKFAVGCTLVSSYLAPSLIEVVLVAVGGEHIDQWLTQSVQLCAQTAAAGTNDYFDRAVGVGV
jgi:hypothetical protein